MRRWFLPGFRNITWRTDLLGKKQLVYQGRRWLVHVERPGPGVLDTANRRVADDVRHRSM